MSKAKVFKGGVPTGPDVISIREAFPDATLIEGQIIEYSEIESLLDIDKDSSRFKTITNQWRKVVEGETNIIIGVEIGVGFKILSDKEKVCLSGSKLRSAANSAKRSVVVSSKVEVSNLDEADKKKLDHYTIVQGKILSSYQIRSTTKIEIEAIDEKDSPNKNS